MEYFKNGILPREFRDGVYISANNEFALLYEKALLYLDWCSGNKILVLGLDTWLPTKPNPTVYTGFSVDGNGKKCIENLKQFNINRLKDKEDMSFVFNIWTEFDNVKM